MVQLGSAPPHVLLAQHLEDDQPVLVYRVADLERELELLRGRSVQVGAQFEIPHGPGAELVIPGPQRVALYQLTRPDVGERLAGRRDF